MSSSCLELNVSFFESRSEIWLWGRYGLPLNNAHSLVLQHSFAHSALISPPPAVYPNLERAQFSISHFAMLYLGCSDRRESVAKWEIWKYLHTLDSNHTSIHPTWNISFNSSTIVMRIIPLLSLIYRSFLIFLILLLIVAIIRQWNEGNFPLLWLLSTRLFIPLSSDRRESARKEESNSSP